MHNRQTTIYILFQGECSYISMVYYAFAMEFFQNKKKIKKFSLETQNAMPVKFIINTENFSFIIQKIKIILEMIYCHCRNQTESIRLNGIIYVLIYRNCLKIIFQLRYKIVQLYSWENNSIYHNCIQ